MQSAQIAAESLREVRFGTQLPYFQCESSLFYFKKRKFQVLSNYPLPEIPPPPEPHHSEYRTKDIYLGVSNEWWDSDSQLLAAMRKS